MKYRYQSLWTLLAKLNDTSNIVAIRFDDPQGHPDAPSGLVASGIKGGPASARNPQFSYFSDNQQAETLVASGPFCPCPAVYSTA